MVLGTWNVRFTPNLIFRLAFQLLITLLKIILIGAQGPVPPIEVKSVYWGHGHLERPIRTKFNIQSSIPTLNNTTKNYPYWSTESGTSHRSQIGILGYWAHGPSDSHQI